MNNIGPFLANRATNTTHNAREHEKMEKMERIERKKEEKIHRQNKEDDYYYYKNRNRNRNSTGVKTYINSEGTTSITANELSQYNILHPDSLTFGGRRRSKTRNRRKIRRMSRKKRMMARITKKQKQYKGGSGRGRLNRFSRPEVPENAKLYSHCSHFSRLPQAL